MVKVAFVGWRGMVGSVLMDRMLAENDFNGFEPLFFTTSQVGQPGPAVGMDTAPLEDAFDTARLAAMEIIVTCQGSDYTQAVHPKLRAEGWQGLWIDAASALRMTPESTIVLDPVNMDVIHKALVEGKKDFIGGNCTVSLMLMGLGGLFRHHLVEWLTSMTYQAASGAGAKSMRELVAQMAAIGNAGREYLADPASAILELDRRVQASVTDPSFPTENFGAALGGGLIPWIDRPLENGQTREEWKGMAETNKILQHPEPVKVDGLCVRIGAMRCHSQALTIKLKKDIPLDEVKQVIAEASPWVQVVPNTKRPPCPG